MLRDSRQDCGSYFGPWRSLVAVVDRDTQGASVALFWGVRRAVSTRPILMRLSATTPSPPPAMHACVTLIEAAAESVASLEHADAAFATDAPPLRFAEPALLLALAPLCTLGTERRNRDPCDSPLLRRRFVGGGEEPGVAGRHARHHAEPLLMLFNRRDQQGRVRRPLVIHLVGDNDLVFRLLDFNHLAEFGGLARFSFADDFGGVFKQTDDLARRVGDALDNPSARLAHDLLHAGKHRVEFFFHALQGRLLKHVRGVLDSLDDLDREALGLSHHLSGRAQQFAVALLQLFLNLRSAPAAGPSDLD